MNPLAIDFDRWINVTGLIVSILGAIVSLYTFAKVKRVQAAQAAARRTTEELLNIDELEVDLNRVMTRLRQAPDMQSVQLAGEIGVKLGMIRGVRRTFQAQEHSPDTVPIIVRKGFFTEQFVAENVGSARQCIDVITGRTKLVAGFYILDGIRRACERGVTVRIIGLSPAAPDAILADALKTVSNPAPRDAEDYRQQICHNRDEILTAVRTWPKSVSANFHYCVNQAVPRVSIMRADSRVNFGFLQFYSAAQPAELSDREYFQLPIGSEVARSALKHIDLAWEEGEVLFPEMEQPK